VPRSSARPLWIALGVFGLATLTSVLWLGYGRALALSIALAVPAAESWLPGADVVREEVQIPFAGRTLAADLYRSVRPRGTILLVHGLSGGGRRQADLARLARLLARHGPLAVVPQFDSLAAFKLDGREVAAIVAALDYAAGVARPVAVAGFSFGAGPALLAAAERPDVRLAGSFGGYADLRAVVAYVTTEASAEPYNRWKLLQLLAGLVGDASDRAGLDSIARARLANPFEDTSRREAELRSAGRAVLALVHNRRADAVSGLLAGLSSDTHTALDRLSPLSAMSRLRGRALIAHGRADSSIPYTESVRLAEAADTQAVILSTFHHTGPLSFLELMRSGVPDGWKLVGLAEALLSVRSR
jgi:pimeloyl-ACP methyl ester carboxylesterase